jgi:hypothetical protein
MAFNDLSAQAQEGLNYAANKIKNADGTPKFATGKIFGDFVMESAGLEWLEQKADAKRQRRIAALDNPANASLAALVDALPE